MTAHRFEPDPAQVAQIAPAEAVRFVEAFRLPGEDIYLQTFTDGPETLYNAGAWVDKYGREHRFLEYGLKVDGKVKTGRTAAGKKVTLDELGAAPFQWANLARVGVFWTVNVLKADATRRTSDNVERVAGVFIDLDGAPLPDSFPLEPTAIVESSPGRYHVYWAVQDVPLSEFETFQKYLAALYGADPVVCDLSRVMRLPGYYWGKQEPGFITRLLDLRPENQYTRGDLLGAWPDLDSALAAAAQAEQARHEQAQRARENAQALAAEIAAGSVTDQTSARVKWAQSALIGGVADVLDAGEGRRNDTLNKVAYRLGRLVAAGVLDEVQVVESLTGAAQENGLEQHETSETLHSGLSAGKKKPADLSNVGTLAGKKKEKERPLTTPPAAEPAPVEADDIPDPEGENGSYSDRQILTFLSLDFPVVAATTDKAHSYRLHALAGPDLLFVPELGGYAAWNGKQWLSGGKDGAGQIEAKRRVQSLGLAMEPEIERLLSLYTVLDVAVKRLAREHGPDSREVKAMSRKAEAMEKAYYTHSKAARGTESDSKQAAILSSARPLFAQSVKVFEPRPWVVGFQNGTWDNGTFREHRREDYMLTLAAVPYEPDAPRHDWYEVLNRITGGDAEFSLTLQHIAGYALSGASSMRLLPWFYGEGGTGKSTFTELLGTVLGEMAATIDPKLFAADAARERLGATIWGKRAAFCAEAGNARLDAEALKTLSGGDRVSVRMLYAESFTARASHVLMMVANDPPRVEAYDEALKDRVLALPFNHRLDAGPPLLGGKRLEELRLNPDSDLVRGFTAWAVEGLAQVHAAGTIYRAPVCVAATREFWGDVDPLHEFWLEQDISELVMGVGVTEFRKRYEAWCEASGGRPVGAPKFKKACESVGLEVVKISDYSEGKRKQLSVIKLVIRKRFPLNDSGDESTVTGVTTFSPISQNSFSSSLREREENRFSEKGKKVVTVVTPEPLAPPSGEL